MRCARVVQEKAEPPMKPCLAPYEPLNVLKPVAPEVWLVDGPETRMAYLGLQLPFSTRMTVVRLADGGLWVHSPIPLVDGLASALAGLGPVAHIVAPNTLHHSWVGEWADAHPQAEVHAVPGLETRLQSRLARPPAILGERPPAAWGGAFGMTLIRGDLLTEADFFHAASRTLVLTDLIENFEPHRVCGAWRWLMRLGGAMDPDGSAPHDMRLSFWRQRAAVRAAAEQMIAWDPERVILAHGRWYERDGRAELQRAFAWVAGKPGQAGQDRASLKR
jgi:hypothetical protein